MWRITYQTALFTVLLGGLLPASHGAFPSEKLTQSAVRESLSQMGEYRFIFRMFFKLYDAALYSSAPDIQDADTLLNGQHTVHLEFDYLRKIDRSIILKSSGKIIPKNMSDAEYALINDRVDQINDAYRTVKKGDRSALTFIPGRGTTLWINEEAVLTVPGDDFARLYFRIWLGDAPISKTMRDTLLGVN